MRWSRWALVSVDGDEFGALARRSIGSLDAREYGE
jgi:hypothetical protein